MTMTTDEFRDHLEAGFSDTNAHDIERMTVDQLDWFMWAQSDRNHETAQAIELRKAVDAELKAETYENKIVAFNKQIINGTAYGIIAAVVMIYGYMMGFALGSIFAYNPQSYPLRGEYEYATEWEDTDTFSLPDGEGFTNVVSVEPSKITNEVVMWELFFDSSPDYLSNDWTDYWRQDPSGDVMNASLGWEHVPIEGMIYDDSISYPESGRLSLPDVKVINCIAGIMGFPILDYATMMGGQSQYKTFMNRFQCQRVW